MSIIKIHFLKLSRTELNKIKIIRTLNNNLSTKTEINFMDISALAATLADSANDWVTALATTPIVDNIANNVANNILYQLLIFAISIVVLAKASHIVIKNSVKLARITKLGELVFGFILLSVATSMPELAVSFSAIASGNVGISIGNLLGSNVANLGLVLAIPAMMAPIAVRRGTFRKLPSLLFFSSIIPLFFLTMHEMSRFVGGALIAVFVLFALYSMKRKLSLKLVHEEPKDLLKKLLMPFQFYKALALLLFGILIVIVSSTFVVSSASGISSSLGIAESVIGATIIAIGTSLPELSVSLTAIKTKHHRMAIGTTIGSCLTNITLILGIVLLLSPAAVNIKIFSTLLFFVIGITMVSWYFFTTGRKLDRMEGTILLFIYILFLISTFGVQLVII